MITLIAIILLVRLVKLVYRLCHFNNLQMPDNYVKQSCCPIKMLGNRSNVFLEKSYITNVSSVRIYIVTTMCYPTQFSMSGKLKKKDLEYHTLVLHDEINFDWSWLEFKYQDEPIFFPSTIQVPLHGRFRTRKIDDLFRSKIKNCGAISIIVYVLNEHEVVPPKLINLEMLTNDHDKSETQSDIVEELIQIQTDDIVLN